MKRLTAIGLVAVLAGCTAQTQTPLVAEERGAATAVALEGRLVFVDLADPGDGIALVGQCTQKPFRCRQRIAALENGTRWELRKSPLADFTNPNAGFTAELIALTPGHAIVVSPPDELVGTTRWQQWFTEDGARTWREVSVKPIGTVTTIPTGARLLVDGNTVVVIDPETGLRRVLKQQPPLRELPAHIGIPAYDGSWWIAGTDPRTGDQAVAVSRDAGRTWTVSRLGKFQNASHTRFLAGPTAVYVTVNGQLRAGEQVKNGLLAIIRSTDGGRTWQRMWTYRPGREPLSNVGTILGWDGSLRVITEMRGSYVSRDGGRTFTWSDTRSGWVHETRGGYLTAEDESRYLVSTDGLTWRTVTVTTG